MISLSWNEVRDRAIAFSRKFANEASEAAGKQTFWNEFFAVFGKERRTVASFEVPVVNLKGKYNRIDLLWRGTLLVEHKSAGMSLAQAESQAFDYIQDLIREGRTDEVPRYVILSDFSRVALYDLEPEEQQDLPIFAGMHYTVTTFLLSEFPKFVRHFAFIKGEKTLRINPEDPANERAYDRMCRLHDELERGGFSGSHLEKLLVRILFCLFSEDTNVFEPNAFSTFVRDHTREDGSDLGARLNELFHVLNTPTERRSSALHETLAIFPYVNGRLFADALDFASFNRSMRDRLIEATDLQWARVSPAVFGSLFQGIMGKKERRQQGAHYTFERDIMKVIRSLFLDDLRGEFDAIRDDKSRRRIARLKAFHDTLRSLRFLDPACGCGNFLVLAYRELRLLELDLLRELNPNGQQVFDVRDLVQVDVDQFYGIEYAEWPARIAEVAMWLMDHQMNQRVSETFGYTFERLPLRTTPHIFQGNALRTEWQSILPPKSGVFVLGNPPFVGKQFRNAAQQSDVEVVWRGVNGARVLDYVSCWYAKAAAYISGTDIRVAFVSTNSISQGEQVGILWSDLFERWNLKIHFAHRTFTWRSEARGQAHVHIVIIGVGTENPPKKHIYDYDVDHTQGIMTHVSNISPYLVEGNDVVVVKRSRPLCNVPDLVFGSMPNDSGHLLLSSEEKNGLVAVEPIAEKFIRPFLGSEEFLNGIERWCLWLIDASPGELRQLPEVMRRIEGVRTHRSSSSRQTTRNLSDFPSLFGEIRQPKTPYLLIPGVSSINRHYIPVGFLPPHVIASNLVYCLEHAMAWHFGILSSSMHMAWVRVVAGRLKSDYRYSNQLVFNNFPWPQDVTPNRHGSVVSATEALLAARVPYLPPHGVSTLADLYDPLTMPKSITKAHAVLDRAIDRCYRTGPFKSDRERVEHLFARYEVLTAPLLTATPEAGRPRKKTDKIENTGD